MAESSSTSTSTSTTVSSRQLPPGALDQIGSTSAELLAAMQKAMGLHESILGQMKVSIEGQQQAVGDSSTAAQDAIKATALEADTQEAQKLKQVAAFSSDVLSEGSQMQKVVKDYSVANEMLRVIQPELTRIAAIDPAKDPLGWLVGQFQMVGVSQQWNNAARMRDTSMQAISEMSNATLATQSMVPAALQGVRRDKTRAEAALVEANARLKKAELDDKYLNNQLNSLGLEAQLVGKKLDIQRNLAELTQRSVSTTTSTTSGERNTEKDSVLASVNAKRRMLGLAPVESLAVAKLGSKDLEEEFGNSIGYLTQFAATPEASLMLVKYANAMPKIRSVMPEAAQFYDVANSAAQEKLRVKNLNLGDLTWQKLSPWEKEKQAFKEVFADWDKEAGAKTNDQLSNTNPRKILPKLVVANPELANNSYRKFIQDQLTATGVVPTEKMLVEYGAAQVAAKIMTPDQAGKELSEFYNKGYKFQLDKLGISLVGMNALNPARKIAGKEFQPQALDYLVNRPVTEANGFFGNIGVNAQPVNVLNEVEAINLITGMVAGRSAIEKRAGQKLLGGGMGQPK